MTTARRSGVNAVTFAAGRHDGGHRREQAVGVASRDGAVGGTNHRVTFIENDGTFFDAIGTFLSSSYNNAAVRAPDGTRGVTLPVLRIYDPPILSAQRQRRRPWHVSRPVPAQLHGHRRLAADAQPHLQPGPEFPVDGHAGEFDERHVADVAGRREPDARRRRAEQSLCGSDVFRRHLDARRPFG